MAKTAEVKKTVRGVVIATRTFSYKRDGADHPAGELILRTPGSGICQVALFGDALSHCDGQWFDPEAWAFKAGPSIQVGQWVQAHGTYSETIWNSQKFGAVTQHRLAVVDPDDVSTIQPPKRPGTVPDKPARPGRPKRPKAV